MNPVVVKARAGDTACAREALRLYPEAAPTLVAT